MENRDAHTAQGCPNKPEMNPLRRAAGLLVAILAASCGPDGADVGGLPVVQDSAGVRVVENGELSSAGWRVGVEPRFTVGWDDDDPTFTWVQSGRILPDGGALVTDFTTGMLFRIGPDGSVTRTWGGKGEGPGEFQGLDAVLLRGDSILVSDGRLARLTILAPDGSVRTETLRGAPRHQVSSALPDGRLLMVAGDGYGAVAETRPEWVFETQPVLALHPGQSAVDTLAELPHLRRWYGTRGASPGPVQVKGRAGGFGEGFAWARSDRAAVRWYDGSGRLLQIARWDEEPVPLNGELRSHVVGTLEQTFRSINDDDAFVNAQLSEVRELLDQHEGPIPYWDTFRVDRLGNVWLDTYTLQGQASRTEWRVVARDGAIVGWVDLPELAAVLDITEDRILGVRLDEMDVPAVVMLELIK